MCNKSKQTYSIRFFNFYNVFFQKLENKHDAYRDKAFCKSLREYAIEIINFKKKKIIKKLLTKEQKESYENAKI